jgi:hypothetical protein
VFHLLPFVFFATTKDALPGGKIVPTYKNEPVSDVRTARQVPQKVKIADIIREMKISLYI